MKTLDEMPDVLTREDIQAVMRCGINHAYELLNRIDFPVIKFGSKKVTPRESFKKWMFFEAEKNNECLNCPNLRVIYRAYDGDLKMMTRLNKTVSELQSWLDNNNPPDTIRAIVVKEIELTKRAMDILHGKFTNPRRMAL